MAPGKLRTTDKQIDAALKRARRLPELPRATAAEYDPKLDLVTVSVDNGRRLVIPRQEMQGLENATQEQLSQIEIFGGLDIAWPQLDVDHYLLDLLEGSYSTEKWKKTREQRKVAA